MIAKLSKGGSFSGAVQYIFGLGKGADCLAGMGVLFKDTPSIIRGFERQAPRTNEAAGEDPPAAKDRRDVCPTRLSTNSSRRTTTTAS